MLNVPGWTSSRPRPRPGAWVEPISGSRSWHQGSPPQSRVSHGARCVRQSRTRSGRDHISRHVTGLTIYMNVSWIQACIIVVGVTLSCSTEESDVGYQLDVVTGSVAEAVRYVGGLMFDRSGAGWRVRVVTEDRAHRRALTILGTVTESPEEHDDSLHNPNRVVRSLLVSIEQFTEDAQAHAVQRHETEGSCRNLGMGPARPQRVDRPVAPRTARTQRGGADFQGRSAAVRGPRHMRRFLRGILGSQDS